MENNLGNKTIWCGKINSSHYNIQLVLFHEINTMNYYYKYSNNKWGLVYENMKIEKYYLKDTKDQFYYDEIVYIDDDKYKNRLAKYDSIYEIGEKFHVKIDNVHDYYPNYKNTFKLVPYFGS